MEASTEVAKTAGSNVPAMMDGWESTEVIRQETLLIPRIALMQKTSKLVEDEKASVGDLAHSTDQRPLCAKGEALEVVPLSFYEQWKISDVSGTQPKFVRYEELNAANARDEWNFEEAGVPMRRDQVINVFVLLKSGLASVVAGEQDLANPLFPLLISFSRTSHKAGRSIVTQFAMAKQIGQPAARYTFSISTEKISGEGNSWYVFNATKTGVNTDEELGACREWHKLVSNRAKIVVDADEFDTAAAIDVEPVKEEDF